MFNVFKTGVAAFNAGTGADNQRKTAMEADTISKHGRSSTSHKSRGNYQIYFVKNILLAVFLTLSISTIFTACGGGQLSGRWEYNGNPNDSYYVFSGNSYTYGYPCYNPRAGHYYSIETGTFLVSGNEIELNQEGYGVNKKTFLRKEKNMIEIGGQIYVKK